MKSLKRESTVLDIGAGAGLIRPYQFARICSKVTGIDIDPRIKQNPNITESVCADFYDNEFENNSFDIIFTNSVMEHIEEPHRFLTEVNRIMKPSGSFFMKTPNRWHYVSIFAQLTQLWFHKFYCQLMGRHPDDTFPTYYKVNSYRAIKQLCENHNLDFEFKSYESSPDYLFLDPVSFLLGVGYERSVNKLNFLRSLRNIIMVKIKFNDT